MHKQCAYCHHVHHELAGWATECYEVLMLVPAIDIKMHLHTNAYQTGAFEQFDGDMKALLQSFILFWPYEFQLNQAVSTPPSSQAWYTSLSANGTKTRERTDGSAKTY